MRLTLVKWNNHAIIALSNYVKRREFYDQLV